MSYKQLVSYVFFVLFFAASGVAMAIPAFPGAYGFGANSEGGRGGEVIKVTNLNDSGAGSFRAAVEASGPRTVVFDVSGIINLQSDLNISNSNLTIAGQTSPGGILVTGYPTRFTASDVIVRHIRFRVGSHQTTPNGGNSDPEQHDAVQIWGNGAQDTSVSDIVFDHVSVGWGIDENFEFAYNPTNITIQNSLISEGLTNAGHPKGSHGKGMLVWNKFSPDIKISLLNNFFAHNQDRNPEINTPSSTSMRAEVVNNVAFNWFGGIVMTSYDQTPINWIGNYARKGPSSNASSWELLHYQGSDSPAPYVYVNGNRGLNDFLAGVTEWRVSDSWRYQLQSEAWRRSTPWDMSSAPFSATVPSNGTWANEMVADVGATVPVRDSVDLRAVNDFLASETSPQGSYLSDVSYPQDFPTFQNLPAPIDADNDGMADAWEVTQGFNPSVNDSALDADGDGYTNIEEYLHVLAGDVEGVIPDPDPEPDPDPVGGKAPVITGAEVIYPSE